MHARRPGPRRTLVAAERRCRRSSATPLPTPLMVVDLDAFDANADDLVRRAAGKPIRVASKSVRVPALLRRALARDGFHGRAGVTRCARRCGSTSRRSATTWSSPTRPSTARRSPSWSPPPPPPRDHADGRRRRPPRPRRLGARPPARSRSGSPSTSTPGCGSGGQHVGPKRSPLLRHRRDRRAGPRRSSTGAGFHLAGVMTYEGQIAGLPTPCRRQQARSLIVRRLKSPSVAQLEVRRREIADALAEVAELEFWNAGGSGSVDSTTPDPVVTEIAAGSGLLVPAPLRPLPSRSSRGRRRSSASRSSAAPSRPVVTVHGGGLVASGPAGKDRLPIPWAPSGLHLTGLEGAGEVQTPLTGPGAPRCWRSATWCGSGTPSRRAVRARQHRPPAGRRRVRRRGADLPRAAGWRSDGRRGPDGRSPRSSTTRWRSRRGSAAAGWSASTGRPAPASRRWPRRSPRPARPRRPVHVIHIDDLFDGWRGLPGGRRAARRRRRAAGGRPARRATGATTGTRGASPRSTSWRPIDLLVLEGVGTGHPLAARPASTALVWVEAPTTTSGWPAGWRATARRCGPSGSSDARRGGVLRRARAARERRGPDTSTRSGGSCPRVGPCFLPPASSSRSRAAATAPSSPSAAPRCGVARARRAAAPRRVRRGRDAPGGRGQLLMPWPNRIRDGAYSFGGRDLQLALTEPAAATPRTAWSAGRRGRSRSTRRTRCRWATG